MSTIFKIFFSVLRLAILAGLFAVSIWGWKLYKDPQFLPIRQVKVIATYEKVNPKSLSKIIVPYITAGGLLSINIENLKQTILQNPWIYHVVVKRVWPDEITITIQEQKAVAVWNKDALLNAQGDIFSPPHDTFPPNLPNFSAPPTQQKTMLQAYDQFSKTLGAYQRSIANLTLNLRGSWQMILDNGVQITLGRLDPNERFARFIAVYPTVFASQIQNITTIDLRYPDGIAVGWKTASAEQV